MKGFKALFWFCQDMQIYKLFLCKSFKHVFPVQGKPGLDFVTDLAVSLTLDSPAPTAVTRFLDELMCLIAVRLNTPIMLKYSYNPTPGSEES